MAVPHRFHRPLKFIPGHSENASPILRFIISIDANIFAIGREDSGRRISWPFKHVHGSAARFDIDRRRQRIDVAASFGTVLLPRALGAFISVLGLLPFRRRLDDAMALP